MPAPVLQFKRGNAGVAGTVPALRPGEPAISTNNFDFFVGIDTTVAGNKFFGSHRYWGREDGSNSLLLKLVDKDGLNSVNLKSPDTVSGVTTYTFPETPVDTYFLKTNSNGDLEWSNIFPSIEIDQFQSGIATFTDNTNNTLGDPNTGGVQIVGGLGVVQNVTIGAGLSVGGSSYFNGTATFYGGTINIGDSDTDDIVFGGEIKSNLVPTDDNAYDLGSESKRWRNASFSGIGTFATGAVISQVKIGIGTPNSIDTNFGNLILNSIEGTVVIDDQLDVSGISTFTSLVDINGGATIDNVRIGIAEDNTIDTIVGDLNLDSNSNQTNINDNLSVVGFTTITGDFTLNGNGFIGQNSSDSILFNSVATFVETIVGTISTTNRSLTVDTTTAPSGTYYPGLFSSDTGTESAVVHVDSGISYDSSNSDLTLSNNVIAKSFNSSSTTLQAPTIGDYSGERLRIYDFNDPGNTNYAIGAESNHIWFGVDSNTDGIGFKWYGEETQVMRLGGTGNLTIAGDFRLDGGDIKAYDGTTAVSISTITGNVRTGGDLLAGSGYLASQDGTRSLYMYDTSGDVSFQGKAIVNEIRSSSNATTLITLNDLDATFARNVVVTGITTVGTSLSSPTIRTTDIKSSDTDSTAITVNGSDVTVVGDLRINGNDIKASDGNINITLTSNTLTEVKGDLQVTGNRIRSSTNATAITLSGNDVIIADDLTINGNLFVSGNTTQVDTTSLSIEDRTIELGMVDGSAPSAATTWDLGVLFNYFKNEEFARKSALVWEHSDLRFKLASEISESIGTGLDNPQISITSFAPIEVSELWINNSCTGGATPVITCVGNELTLQNVSLDGGSF